MSRRAIDHFDHPMRLNLRERRAESVSAAVLKELRGLIEPDAEREAFRRLLDLLTSQGVEVLCDYDREQAGLPPRGPDGWTLDEVLALEKHKLELLNRPLPPIVLPIQQPPHGREAPG